MKSALYAGLVRKFGDFYKSNYIDLPQYWAHLFIYNIVNINLIRVYNDFIVYCRARIKVGSLSLFGKPFFAARRCLFPSSSSSSSHTYNQDKHVQIIFIKFAGRRFLWQAGRKCGMR